MNENAPEFYSERRVKTRKPHRCYETRRDIPKGAQAVIVTGKWDGEVRSMYFLPEAMELWKQVDQQYRKMDEELCFGGLHEHFVQQKHYNPDDPLVARWEELCQKPA